MHKLLTITFIIVITSLGFLSIYSIGFVFLQFNQYSNNAATILSGTMGLFGGIIGAFGAYFIATFQIKKQNENRVIEIKLDKFNEIASLLERLEYHLNRHVDIFKHRIYLYEIRLKDPIFEEMDDDVNLSLLSIIDEMNMNKDEIILIRKSVNEIILELQKYRIYYEIAFKSDVLLNELTIHIKKFDEFNKIYFYPDYSYILDQGVENVMRDRVEYLNENNEFIQQELLRNVLKTKSKLFAEILITLK